MSEWYSYNHDEVAVATEGVYFGPALFTGDGGTSLYLYTLDLSSTDYAGGDLVGMPSTFETTLFIAHKQASSGGQPYQADLQLTKIGIDGANYGFESFPSSPHGSSGWTTTINASGADPTPATPGNAATLAEPGAGVGYSAVANSNSSQGRWNWQSDGEGGSGSTGVPDPSGAFFFESSGGTRRNEWSFLKSPAFQDISSNSVVLAMYRFGAAIGTVYAGIKIDDAACFIEGTLITMYDGTYKPIEEVEIGDVVFTQVGKEEVLELLSPIHGELVAYNFSDGTKTTNTKDHPYYVVDKGWCSNVPYLTKERYDIETYEFICGDICVNDNNEQIKLVTIEEIEGEFKTYTFSTDSETFYANRILVHSEM